MKYKFIDVQRSMYSIRLLCRVLEISKSSYYKWIGNNRTSKKDEYRALVDKIEQLHNDSRKTYGSPRIFQKLKKGGEKISKNTVAKLMSENSIQAKTKKKFKLTTDSKHNLNVSPNLLARNFNPENINQAWCGDITYIHTNEGWLFHEEFETRNEAKRKIFEYIEVFYNRERIHSVLDFKSPIEYELNVA